MDDRQFEVSSTEHPSGAITGRCRNCGGERTSTVGDVMAWKYAHKCPETVAKPVYATDEPVERPGEQETAMDDTAPAREQFGDFERNVLTFEEEWARTHPRTGHADTGPKMAAIHECFPEISSVTRYYQVLNRIIDMDEAALFKPSLVGRLRHRRQVARETRAGATERGEEIRRETATSLLERCEALAALCRRAGMRAGPGGGASRSTPTHVVISTGPYDGGYYRLVPGVGEAVTIYFVPAADEPVRDLGHVLTHARAAGVVLDHIAGVTP